MKRNNKKHEWVISTPSRYKYFFNGSIKELKKHLENDFNFIPFSVLNTKLSSSYSVNIRPSITLKREKKID